VKGRGACRVLVGKSEGKKPLRRPRHSWEDSTKMDLQGEEAMDWFDLAQDTDKWRNLVKAVMTLQVPRNAGNFLTS
jgi:hypothetical protein